MHKYVHMHVFVHVCVSVCGCAYVYIHICRYSCTCLDIHICIAEKRCILESAIARAMSVFPGRYSRQPWTVIQAGMEMMLGCC